MTEWNKVKIDGIFDDFKEVLDGKESDAIIDLIMPNMEHAMRDMVKLASAKTREEESLAARSLRIHASWVKRFADYIAQRAESDWEF